MSNQPNRRFRVLGLLPLIFFLVQTAHYWRYGGLGNLLWMCNIGNLLLAIGLFLDHRELIRAAAIWTLPGLVVWFRYVLWDYGFLLSSTLAHVGGILIGLIALRRVGMDRTGWLYVFIWSLFMQITARPCHLACAEREPRAQHTTGMRTIFRQLLEVLDCSEPGSCRWPVGTRKRFFPGFGRPLTEFVISRSVLSGYD